MESVNVMDYLVALGIILYGAFLTYKSVALYIQGKKAKAEYKEAHKNYEEVNQAQTYFYVFVAMTIAGIVLAVISTGEDPKQLFYFRVAYIMMTIIFGGMSLDCLTKRKAIFDDNGFFYEKSYYRYRSVISVQENKGLMRNTQVKTLEEDKIMISKKMGNIFNGHYENWKNRKKNKK